MKTENKLHLKIPLLLAAIAVVNMQQGCKKYEDGPAFSLRTKKSRLTGEWELSKVTYLNGGISTSSGEQVWEIEKDGDITFTYSYAGYSYSYKGDWEWEDGKDAIEITIGNYKEDYDILRLTNKELTLEANDGDVYEFDKQ